MSESSMLLLASMVLVLMLSFVDWVLSVTSMSFREEASVNDDDGCTDDDDDVHP